MRRIFDSRSPVTEYISVPQPYVILQRINVGPVAVLGELSATANWRPGPTATPMGRPRPHD